MERAGLHTCRLSHLRMTRGSDCHFSKNSPSAMSRAGPGTSTSAPRAPTCAQEGQGTMVMVVVAVVAVVAVVMVMHGAGTLQQGTPHMHPRTHALKNK